MVVGGSVEMVWVIISGVWSRAVLVAVIVVNICVRGKTRRHEATRFSEAF